MGLRHCSQFSPEVFPHLRGLQSRQPMDGSCMEVKELREVPFQAQYRLSSYLFIFSCKCLASILVICCLSQQVFLLFFLYFTLIPGRSHVQRSTPCRKVVSYLPVNLRRPFTSPRSSSRRSEVYSGALRRDSDFWKGASELQSMKTFSSATHVLIRLKHKWLVFSVRGVFRW